jgi:hypothetical protein
MFAFTIVMKEKKGRHTIESDVVVFICCLLDCILRKQKVTKQLLAIIVRCHKLTTSKSYLDQELSSTPTMFIRKI